MQTELLIPTMAALAAGALGAGLIVNRGWGAHDPSHPDPQHVHARLTPRIGGVAIVFAIAVSLLIAVPMMAPLSLALMTLAIALPAFALGLLEDFFGRASPRWRYYATLAVGAAAWFAVDAQLCRLDVPMFDAVLAGSAVCLVVSMFCVAGVAQAYNLIDGLNGLAAGTAVMAVFLMALSALSLGDLQLALLGLVMGAALGGFLLFNFPAGRIFLGDGGAYYTGSVVALMSILTVSRHPQVSAWFPLLLSAYPVLETLMSLLRRLTIEPHAFHEPDRFHLHSLLHRRLERLGLHGNALASVSLLVPTLALGFAAYWGRMDAALLQTASIGIVATYVLVYVLLRRSTTAPLAGSEA